MKSLPFKDKKILVSLPYNVGLHDAIVRNLKHVGFEVFLLPSFGEVRLPLKEKCIHGIRKIFKDRSYKLKRLPLRKEPYAKQWIDETGQNFDYALVIRPDMLSAGTIRYIRKKSKLTIGYQWDGMSRFTQVKGLVDEFDKFYIFDEKDRKEFPQCLHTTNFYFDFPVPTSEIKYDVYFVGACVNHERTNLIISLLKYFEQADIHSDFYVSRTERMPHDFRGIKFHKLKRHHLLSYQENLEKLQAAKAIVDLQHTVHSGFSLRVFESLGFRKKLITTNALVKNYDFFHPNNVYILTPDNFDGIKAFLEKPYHELPEEIYQQYSFTGWITKMLLPLDKASE